MPLEIKFSVQATDTFNDVIDQLQQRWGNKIVRDFRLKVSRALDAISESPFIYPVAEENEEMRKCVLHKNCSMYYWVYDDIVEILYFWDNRQEPLSF
jgi:plasmid stabilization system protein ParE